MTGETNLSSTDRCLIKFFRSKLVPVAEKLRSQGLSFYPQGRDENLQSWYEPPTSGDELFELDQGWEKALEELWASQGLEELVVLVDSLSKLAETLEVQETEAEEVSPFIYVMY